MLHEAKIKNLNSIQDLEKHPVRLGNGKKDRLMLFIAAVAVGIIAIAGRGLIK